MHIFIGDRKTHGQSRKKPLDHRLCLHADRRVEAAGHPRVGDVGRAPGQNLLIRGGNVGMGPDQGRKPPIAVMGQGSFFRSSLGVEINHYDIGLPGNYLQLGG